MKSHHRLFAFFAARYFVPMTVFMTPYLLENKKFTNHEIFDKITPLFFISSLVSSLLSPILVNYIGNRNSMLLETFLEFICFLMFHYMKERDFIFGRLTGILHGVVTSLESVTKGLLVEVKPDYMNNEEIYTHQSNFKKVLSVMSSWLGQDLKNSSGCHKATLMFSLFTIGASIMIGAFIPSALPTKKTGNLISLVVSRDGLAQLREIYTNRVIYFSLLYIIGSTSYICFAMYSVAIFMERKKEIDPSNTALGKIIYTVSYPFKFLSYAIIYLLNLFGGDFQFNPIYEKNSVVYGYIDGISKIFSAAIGTFLSYIIKDRINLVPKTIVSSLLVIFFTFVMGATNSLVQSYAIFVLGSVFSQVSLIWAKSGFSDEKSHLHTIYSVNLVLSSLIHISISYITKYKKYTSVKKMYMYFCINYCLLSLALFVLFKCDIGPVVKK